MSTEAESTPPPEEQLEDEPADMPLTMAASVVLDHLPRDAHSALEHAGELPQAKSKSLSIILFFLLFLLDPFSLLCS